MASQAKKAPEPSLTPSKQRQPAFNPGQIDVAQELAPSRISRHGDGEWLQDDSEREGTDSDATKHSVGGNDKHDRAQEDAGQKDCKKAAQEEQVDECGEVCPPTQADQQQNQLTGNAGVSPMTHSVHRGIVTQPVLRDGNEPGCLYNHGEDTTEAGALASPCDHYTDIKEIKQLLTVVLTSQNVLFDEIRMLKDAQGKTSVIINEALSSHQSDCRSYTDDQVRSLDCRLHGLSAVLDHVQTRCMEAELVRDTFRESETLSSSDAQDDVADDIVKTKAGVPDTVHQKENRSWLRHNHLMLVNNLDLKNGLFIDRLVQDDVLFQSDEDTIRSHSTRKCQVRELVSRIKRCDSDQFMKFKNHLIAEYPHLNCRPSTEDKEETKIREKCVVCNLTDIVDVRDIVDHLYQQNCIDSCTYETIWRNDISEVGWCRLLKGMAGNDSKCTDAMVAALSRKYPKLSQDVACAEGDVLTCCCNKKKH
ncbi:uncharacterized protein LOC124262105 [Haliotis rubra]|uniref:uncharacterized protein LOC124262105 n=1 Tax=Haliotis rubra TaxID=36100 RepID=UPI001EE54C8F|nr:uncharacterized protein LOC124262105 [Haliotis rubra]